MNSALGARRWPIGAELVDHATVDVRVWAPGRRRVAVVVDGDEEHPVALEERDGYFVGTFGGRAGTRYGFRLDDDPKVYPDPASRSQPDGPHGHSMVVDPHHFAWSDRDWRGVSLTGQVLYEMHIGTFTPEGTFVAAARQLEPLAQMGLGVIELMPVAEFPGRFGWGYDGVDLFAPARLYGTPDELRSFVDRAHALGLGVILDVVYNHLGPDGNYLKVFAPAYFTDRYPNEWGEALDFDGPESGPVREFFVTNAAYWITEFHFDGLRLDATQCMHDESPRHILDEIGASVRRAGGPRTTLLIAENEAQDTRLLRPRDRSGFGYDAAWNDDFHHAAQVALTGRCEAYYTDYCGSPQEIVSALKRGYLFQGQRYEWQRKRRGTSTRDIAASAFVDFLENHDQVANSLCGVRTHALANPARQRALTTVLLLGPGTPMLFQGQEFAASAPFLYFADHGNDLGRAVSRGRAEFLAQFASIATPEARARLPEPHDPRTFERCKIDLAERETHGEAVALHTDLIRLRHHDPVIARQGQTGFDGAVLSEHAFVLRWFDPDDDDRILVVNLGPERALRPAPEPLLAPPAARSWRVLFSTHDPRYGGLGTPPVEHEDGGWHLPAECAVLLRPASSEQP